MKCLTQCMVVASAESLIECIEWMNEGKEEKNHSFRKLIQFEKIYYYIIATC